MKYEVSWTVSDWHSLTKTCMRLENDGWEIFTFCPMEAEFCRIIHRRERNQYDNARNNY